MINSGLLAVSLIGCLLLLELAIRFVLPQFNPGLQMRLRPHPTAEIALGQPNSSVRLTHHAGDYDVGISFNSLGLRESKDYTTATARDWFVIGDSFSFGWGVEEHQRFSNLLDNQIPEQVFNISIPGNLVTYQKILDYLHQQDTEIHRLILGLCMENDILDYDRLTTQASPKQASLMTRLKRRLNRHSALYHAIATLVHRSPMLRDLALRAGMIDQQNLQTSANPHAIAATAEIIADWSDQYQLIVLVIPSRSLWQPNSQSAKQTHSAILDHLIDRNVTVIDGAVMYRNPTMASEYHFPNDGHWNRKAHHDASLLVFDRLSQPAFSLH